MQVAKNRQRKLLMLLPFLCIPVILIVFTIYKLTDNKNKKADERTAQHNQFNQSLPSPQINEKEKNKLEIYMEAQQDSIEKKKLVERSESKLYYDPMPPDEVFVEDTPMKAKKGLAHQEKRVNEQLDKIMQELHQQAPSNSQPLNDGALNNSVAVSSDVLRLERLLASMQSGDTTTDPEMSKLDGMLDKIIRIQNPSINKPTAKNSSDSTLPIPIAGSANSGNGLSSGFYSLEPERVTPSTKKTAISAVVHADQIVQNGSTIKLRLLQDIYVDQLKIPANQFVYGTCTISDERLYVTLDRLAYNNTIFPVKLQVYDMDGLPGISVPGAITRDAAKQGIDQTFQSLDPSLSAQVATAGIQSLKSLVSRKIRAVRATVKAGHQVLLQ